MSAAKPRMNFTCWEKSAEELTRPPLLSGMGPSALLAFPRAGSLRIAILPKARLRPRAHRRSFESCFPADYEQVLSGPSETLIVVQPSRTPVCCNRVQRRHRLRHRDRDD